MNYALILSGGIGTRMRKDGFPKQYLKIDNKPILVYTIVYLLVEVQVHLEALWSKFRVTLNLCEWQLSKKYKVAIWRTNNESILHFI